MNIFIPQCYQTRIELEQIADVQKQIITPALSVPIMGIVQDGLLGGYHLTQSSTNIDWKTAMNIISYTSVDDFSKIKKTGTVKGSDLFSLIIPSRINNSGAFEVENGTIKNGYLSSAMLGATKSHSLIHMIWDEYGFEETRKFIDNTQRLINNFLLWNGCSVGFGDTVISAELEDQLYKMIKTKKLEIDHQITEKENNPDLIPDDIFEASIQADLSAVRPNATKSIISQLSPMNNFNVMINSGSKGGPDNVGMMSGCLGQQVLEGKRLPKKYNNRAMAYFHQNDDSASGRGFIERPYARGLSAIEFIFHNMASREGLIDTAIKSVTGDTEVVVMENGIIKQTQIGPWIDQQLEKSKDKVQHFTEREMELLDTENNNSYIPTSDENGVVSWGRIKAITRHDPGKELYEIITKSGRRVIVTESKSLLIWTGEKFERMSTPDVKVGDFVPVTFNLPESNATNIYNFDMNYMIRHKFVEDELINSNLSIVKLFIAKYFNQHGEIKNNTIRTIANSKTINGLCMLLSRFGIFGRISPYVVLTNTKKTIENSIYCDLEDDREIAKIQKKIKGSGLYGDQGPSNEVSVMDTQLILENEWLNKFNYIFNTSFDSNHKTYQFTKQNDVVLDPIIEINKIDVKLYPKVYDLTIPSTLNFGLANGLHVVDTAESGYLQRKLIKSSEDDSVKYDRTVRNSNHLVYQWIYGDTGIDPSKQASYVLKMLELGNTELARLIKFTDTELKNYNFSQKDNEQYFNDVKHLRNVLRVSKLKTAINNISFNPSYMLPINIKTIVTNIKNSTSKNEGVLEPKYIVDKIKDILDYKNTKVTCMTKAEYENPNTLRHLDETMAKSVFQFALYEILSPKQLLLVHGLKKSKFDELVDKIIKQFNNAVVVPGEMVGIVGAQSIGEPITQMTLKTFHSAGIKSSVSLGVPRAKEILSLSTKLKTPAMIIPLLPEYKQNMDVTNRIVSNLKYTTLKDVRKGIKIFYDPTPLEKGGFMDKDRIKNVFFSQTQNKNSCQSDISSLPWLVRIKMDREKMMEKDVTLLDIKSMYCNAWERRNIDSKGMKKEEKVLFEAITQTSILSNTENDSKPIIHIRFDMNSYNYATFESFIDVFIDSFKLKGISSVTKIDNVSEESMVSFDNEDQTLSTIKHNVIYTIGSNLIDIRYLNGIDLNNVISNNIMEIYELYGIDACRAALIREFKTVFGGAGSNVNYVHIELLCDSMTISGIPTSIDRHGMDKTDAEPLARATFEKTVEKLLTAAMFSEIDHMRSASSRIMAGLPFGGGTCACELLLDTEMLQNTEVTEEIVTKRDKNYREITTSSVIDDVINRDVTGIFIPDE